MAKIPSEDSIFVTEIIKSWNIDKKINIDILKEAINKGDYEAMQIAIDLGFTPELYYFTRAALFGYLDILKLLVETREMQDHKYGGDILLCAIKNSHIEIIKFLLENNFKITKVILEYVISCGFSNILEIFCDYKIPEEIDIISIAILKENFKCFLILLEKGFKITPKAQSDAIGINNLEIKKFLNIK